MAKVDYATLKKGGFMRQKQKNNFSLRLAASGHEREKQGKGKLFPLSDRACQLMLTME